MTKVLTASASLKISVRTLKLNTVTAGWVLPQAVSSGRRCAEMNLAGAPTHHILLLPQLERGSDITCKSWALPVVPSSPHYVLALCRLVVPFFLSKMRM